MVYDYKIMQNAGTHVSKSRLFVLDTEMTGRNVVD